MNSQSPFSLFCLSQAFFFLPLQSELNGCVQGCSGVRVSFIRFTSHGQNRGVLDGYMGAVHSCQQPALIPLQVNQTDEQSFAKDRILAGLLLKMQAYNFRSGKRPVGPSDMVKISHLNYQKDNVIIYLAWTFIISEPFDIRQIQMIGTFHNSMHVIA